MDLSFDLVKMQRFSKNEDNYMEAVLNDPISQILDFSDIRTGFGDSPEVMAEKIAPMRV